MGFEIGGLRVSAPCPLYQGLIRGEDEGHGKQQEENTKGGLQ